MKTFWIVMKILAALAIVAGVVFVIAAYGDKIVAWAKTLLNKISFGKAKFVPVEGEEEEAAEADFEEE